MDRDHLSAATGDADETLAGMPMPRMADPDEIGRVALCLASNLSSCPTGVQIVVDGGMLLG